MSDIKHRKWEGGHIHRQGDGRDLYVIARMVSGKRFHISTRTHSESAAHQHLRRFEEDPWGYAKEMRSGRLDSERLALTKELMLAFREWQLTRSHPKPTTRRYANEMAHRISDWIEDLKGMDLKKLDLRTLKEIVVRRETCAQHRIIALKAFCAWLRTEKFLLERKDDITLDLAVPQASPEKHRRRKAVPFEDVKRVLAALVGGYRDCLLLLSRTGWHVTELERFVRDEASRIANGSGDVLAVLQVLHKTGSTTRTPVMDKSTLEAAQRLRDGRTVPRRLNAELARACVRAKAPRFTLGVMRHSFATWAIEAGTSADVVAEFLGHRSKSTTLKFYADVAVPTLPVRLPSLT